MIMGLMNYRKGSHNFMVLQRLFGLIFQEVLNQDFGVSREVGFGNLAGLNPHSVEPFSYCGLDLSEVADGISVDF